MMLLVRPMQSTGQQWQFQFASRQQHQKRSHSQSSSSNDIATSISPPSSLEEPRSKRPRFNTQSPSDYSASTKAPSNTPDQDLYPALSNKVNGYIVDLDNGDLLEQLTPSLYPRDTNETTTWSINTAKRRCLGNENLVCEENEDGNGPRLKRMRWKDKDINGLKIEKTVDMEKKQPLSTLSPSFTTLPHPTNLVGAALVKESENQPQQQDDSTCRGVVLYRRTPRDLRFTSKIGPFPTPSPTSNTFLNTTNSPFLSREIVLRDGGGVRLLENGGNDTDWNKDGDSEKEEESRIVEINGDEDIIMDMD
ncbi:uncharacterized protein VTP21DRAFT_9000 [Calcarisporiella thermophila]|uniref:uncharacterized protein n=1 Tax=Calcarisporiella thermophila TaxID=911321 RepID=UPI0037429AAC